MQTLTIQPVLSTRDQHDFYNFAWRVYRDDPNWVPHLWPQRRDYFERKAAFFTYGEGDFWLARAGKEVVGTIGAAINHARNRDRGENNAIFGFFEVLPDDYEVACALWDQVRVWARGRGCRGLQGPYSFAMNDDNGFLVEGHEYPPAILMGHTPPYYAKFAESYGFHKLMDSLAYRYDFAQIDFDIEKAPAVLHRIAARAIERHGQEAIFSPRMGDWDSLVDALHPVYNRSLAVLPEHSPIELAEFRAQAAALKPVMDPELVFIARAEGQVVGFALGLPNSMEALIHANGLRYPWDYARFAWAKRRIRSASFKILAMLPEYWGHGLEVMMFLEMGRALIRKGYTWADASLTGEENPQTNKLATRLGARVYRRYREYHLAL